MKITSSSLAKVVGSGSGCFPLATFILAFFPPPSPPKYCPLWGSILALSTGAGEGKEALFLGSETRFLAPFWSPATKKPALWDNFCILPERLVQKPGFSTPRNQETGFLRQFLHPTRKIGSETRFLNPPQQETRFLAHPSCWLQKRYPPPLPIPTLAALWPTQGR
jgi:hypothetical protein